MTNGSTKIKSMETRSARFIAFSWPIMAERNPKELLRRLFHCATRMHVTETEAIHATQSNSYGKLAAKSCMSWPKKEMAKAITTRVTRWGIFSRSSLS